MHSEEDLLYGISLLNIKGIGAIKSKSLISHCGGVKEVFKQSYHALLGIPGIGEFAASAIKKYKNFAFAEKEIQFIQENSVEALFFYEEKYPKRLRACPDSPILLFCDNSAPLNKHKILSIVGTRKASNYGKSCITKLLEELQNTDCTIISGMAFGVDIASHEASLKYGLKTCAVVAHGLDSLYPPKHKHTLRKMKSNGGGLVTEFLSNTEPLRENFPKRNRIIAGLADATIVVESDINGGSMITAQLAHDYNREIFAFPGPINAINSKGCNKLIKQNKAYLLESIKDLTHHLGWDLPLAERPRKRKLPPLTQTEMSILNLLEEGEKNTDQLIQESSIPFSKLSLILLDMEFNGYLEALPGNRFKLNSIIYPDSNPQLF